MGSGEMMYIPSFIKTGSRIQKLIKGGGDSKTHRQHGDIITYFYFFKVKKVV
jgi:hypothetical protein